MPAGRPTKYTPELLEKAKAYVDEYESYSHAFPSDIGLADVLGIHTTTLHDWKKDDNKKEFSYILDEIQRKQQIVAWDKGLKGDYNASLVKLLLGKHGYHDKADNVHSGPDGKPIEIDQEWTLRVIDATSDDS